MSMYNLVSKRKGMRTRGWLEVTLTNMPSYGQTTSLEMSEHPTMGTLTLMSCDSSPCHVTF